jgi:micrococcal nuclease
MRGRAPRTRRGLADLLIGVVVLVFVGVVASLLVQDEAESPSPGSAAVTAAEAPLVQRSDGFYLEGFDRLLIARVNEVIDGDTLDVVIQGQTHRVRVFGIAAAERDEPCYEEATEALRDLSGDEVRLLADARREDDFGRWLRYLFTTDGRSIDAALVSSGDVEAWRDDGAYRDVLVGLEGEAKVARRGCLWT